MYEMVDMVSSEQAHAPGNSGFQKLSKNLGSRGARPVLVLRIYIPVPPNKKHADFYIFTHNKTEIVEVSQKSSQVSKLWKISDNVQPVPKKDPLRTTAKLSSCRYLKGISKGLAKVFNMLIIC